MIQTSGLVLVLSKDAAQSDRALEWLRRQPHVELGEPSLDGRLPVVLEADSGEQSDARTRELEGRPGIARVEVVFVGFPPAGE